MDTYHTVLKTVGGGRSIGAYQKTSVAQSICHRKEDAIEGRLLSLSYLCIAHGLYFSFLR